VYTIDYMFASPALCIVAFLCCWGIDQKKTELFFLSEVLIRDDVKQRSVHGRSSKPMKHLVCSVNKRKKLSGSNFLIVFHWNICKYYFLKPNYSLLFLSATIKYSFQYGKTKSAIGEERKQSLKYKSNRWDPAGNSKPLAVISVPYPKAIKPILTRLFIFLFFDAVKKHAKDKECCKTSKFFLSWRFPIQYSQHVFGLEMFSHVLRRGKPTNKNTEILYTHLKESFFIC
jgi:hypothetical protein